MIVSETVLLWFISAWVLGMAIGWTWWDGRNLLRLWSKRRENHDEFFGAIMGLAIMLVGVIGLIRHHLSL